MSAVQDFLAYLPKYCLSHLPWHSLSTNSSATTTSTSQCYVNKRFLQHSPLSPVEWCHQHIILDISIIRGKCAWRWPMVLYYVCCICMLLHTFSIAVNGNAISKIPPTGCMNLLGYVNATCHPPNAATSHSNQPSTSHTSTVPSRRATKSAAATTTTRINDGGTSATKASRRCPHTPHTDHCHVTPLCMPF
ncbi:uncharacterized protein LACBIDRAFT_333856 [Laccaria bicolor S238N-H82]|uniref:Predicted protein n=1 Tax=Laccaria bicolor (strain S238N-H82 / ATCC MYA-4686) TaxID=486041 RepID=B0DXA9_LACBS|nr:uncharacterized protein LACBIDRAFT_333856 [Laccaria bicolor S238N-H82]EDR00802.1 predicted protein [Laccaria bicolor S238N-H82]|eukprot:XP_001888594.1 predicted protein [Laccaria bicolor S238N-H82]